MAEITGDFIRSNAAFKQIPILTLDKNYYKIFSDEADKPETIKVLEEKVNDLLKKQGQINNDIKEVKKIKSRLIQGVVDDMEQDDTDPKHIKKMNESQKLIQEAKEKILVAVGNISGIASVDDQVKTATPATASQFYTVKSGDTLSAISKQVYGNANLYNKIFEANKPMLKSPDKIYPGQVLRIPEE